MTSPTPQPDEYRKKCASCDFVSSYGMPDYHSFDCKFHSSNQEATSLTPLTVEQMKGLFYNEVPELTTNLLTQKLLDEALNKLFSTLTTQHTKEKEELVREISQAIAKRTSNELIETMSNSERLINIAEIYEDIEEIAKKHNITI